MAREIPVTDPLLFLRYAVPCAGTLVKRGALAQSAWDALIAAVAAGEAPAGAERIFKVAYAACSLAAIDAGKAAIDAAVIREYFRAGHDAVIDARYAEMGDFDPEACRVWAGIISALAGGKARVSLPAQMAASGRQGFQERECRLDFVPDARAGEWVVVHWGFLVERVTERDAQGINGRGANRR